MITSLLLAAALAFSSMAGGAPSAASAPAAPAASSSPAVDNVNPPMGL